MNADDAMIVVIVGDDDVRFSEEESPYNFDVEVKQEVLDDTEKALLVEELLQTAEEHGEHLDPENFNFIKKIKGEPSDDEDSDEEFNPDVKSDPSTETSSTDDDDYNDDDFVVKTSKTTKSIKKHDIVKKTLQPTEYKSYVAKVREENPHFNDDQLVAYLAEVFRNIKPPPTPEHNYKVDSSMFECIDCSALSKTWPAAARHYQNKHGPRYLNCFACGADFRSATNLYKHEKMCSAPDAVWVLHARALSQGRNSLSKTECMQKMLNLDPSECNSYVAKVREENPHFDNDQLVAYLAVVMKNVMRPPTPPRDYYRVYSLMFECIDCSTLSDSLPAAAKHYQEKHGPRYLFCFACGADFRSVPVLYKHEKNCTAPDAVWVQRARTICVGRNSRHRPFLDLQSIIKETKPRKYNCTECSAAFLAASSIKAHMRLHCEGRPYSCEQCGVPYTTPSAIFHHRLQHKEKLYICDICGREYKSRNSIAYHMDTHLPRKHICPCGRQFAQKIALDIHVTSRHPCVPPPCPCQLCPRRFTRMSLLKKHMKDEHGKTQNMLPKKLPTLSDGEVKQAKKNFNKDKDHLIFQSPAPATEITVTTQT